MRSTSKTPGVLRGYVLPALWLFALPVFGQWFAGHAQHRFDARVREAIVPEVLKDKRLSPDEREDALAFFNTVSASKACLSDNEALANFRENLGEACSDVTQFAWMYRLSLGLVVLGVVSALIALLCGVAAFVSRGFQYGSFVVGWSLLRVASAFQVAGQGGLAAWLSFWVTALWFQRYSPKLIILVGVAAAIAVGVVVIAIFKRPSMDFEVEAEVLEESAAPEFWATVRRLCKQLETPPPDHILVGIDANFFVTESDVTVGGKTLSGRTLFVSVSLLRLLEKGEAEAVLAHEMGHLLGGDTGHGKRLAPKLAHFSDYLGALYEGGMTRPVYYFMVAYRGLFELSLGKSRRASELAADRLAAEVTSGEELARSLVKVGAYANFRERVEADLFGRNEQQQSVAIARRVAHGFAAYAQSGAVQDDLQGAVTPHPFDSHPPLAARLENVGVELGPDDMVQALLEPVSSSWAEAILEAEAIEARLWGAYESRFSEAHDLALAYRYRPANDEEQRHVEKHFPPVEFAAKEEGHEVQLNFAEVSCAQWEEPVPFEQVKEATTAERLFKKYLDLQLEGSGMFKGKRSICLSKLEDPDALLGAFGHYLGRHRTMKEYQSKSDEAA